jgi:hypothetical protein
MVQVADFGITLDSDGGFVSWEHSRECIEDILGIGSPAPHPIFVGVEYGPLHQEQGCITSMEVSKLPSWDALDQAVKQLLVFCYDSDLLEFMSLTYYAPGSNQPILKVHFENYSSIPLKDNALNLQTSLSTINWPVIINLININDRSCGFTLQTHGFGRLHFTQP